MDQASSRPTSRAVKTTLRPSGEIVSSSLPPKGREGQSASIVPHQVDQAPVGEAVREDVIARAVLPGVPVADEQPVEQPARGLRLAFARSVASRSPRGSFPGKTRIENTAKDAVGRDLEVVDVEREARDRLGLAALQRMRQTCEDPPRVERK